MVFIDGYHSEEQARFDYQTFEGLLDPDGVILLHDSVRCEISRIYGTERVYERRVKCFIDELKRDTRLQVFDLPFDQGITLVRKLDRAEAEGNFTKIGALESVPASRLVSEP
jgi:predicted O-methyltransferase YrrM